MLEGQFDFAAVFGRGHQVTRVRPSAARALLAAAERQPFVPDATMQGLPTAQSRLRAAWLADRQPAPDAFARYGALLAQTFFKPLLALYPRPRAHEQTVLLYCCRQGYEIRWHDHLDYPSIISCLIYLAPEPLPDDAGGTLEVARVTRDDTGAVIGRDSLGRVQPVHGMAVVMDSQSPLFQHRAEPYAGAVPRYFLAYGLGSLF